MKYAERVVKYNTKGTAFKKKLNLSLVRSSKLLYLVLDTNHAKNEFN